MIAFGLAGRGTLYVQNNPRTLVDVGSGNIAAGFNQDFVAVVAQSTDQVESLALRERFAAGYFD